MVDVQREIVIKRPSNEVADFAADPRNAPRWYANIATAELLTAAPLGVGTRSRFSARFLGRELHYTYEVTDWRPARRLVMRTSEGPFPMQTEYRFEDTGDGTSMVLRNTGAPTGFSRVAGLFMAPLMGRAMARDLSRLKALLESTPRHPSR